MIHVYPRHCLIFIHRMYRNLKTRRVKSSLQRTPVTVKIIKRHSLQGIVIKTSTFNIAVPTFSAGENGITFLNGREL